MVSRDLQRLRNAERDLANFYKGYLKPDRQQSMADLKAMRSGYHRSGHQDMVGMINRQITQRTADAVTRLEALQEEVQSAAAAVKAKAQRQRPAATEAAKSDIRAILSSPNATPGSVAQWIMNSHKDQPEYWSALEEISAQMVAAAGPLAGTSRGPRTSAQEVQEAIKAYEPLTYTPQEQSLAREAQEVDGCLGTLQMGMKDAGEFLERESRGLDGILPKFGIRRWSGLPDPQNGRPNGLLQPGKSYIPLTDDKGQFSVVDEQLQEV
jgi:hypothetical protein